MASLGFRTRGQGLRENVCFDRLAQRETHECRTECVPSGWFFTGAVAAWLVARKGDLED